MKPQILCVIKAFFVQQISLLHEPVAASGTGMLQVAVSGLLVS